MDEFQKCDYPISGESNEMMTTIGVNKYQLNQLKKEKPEFNVSGCCSFSWSS